jgi:hypothetical protein
MCKGRYHVLANSRVRYVDGKMRIVCFTCGEKSGTE